MAALPPEVRSWLEVEGLGDVQRIDPVGGGCIHQARILRTASGASFFLKTSPSPPVGIYSAEAAGLKAIQVAGGPKVPQVYLVGENYLLLEDLQPGPRGKDFWSLYGAQLAQLHLQTSPSFGFEIDNFIGSNPQQNTWMEDGVDFFRERRLRPQIQWALKKGLLDPGDARLCEGLLLKLDDFLPEMPSVLLHGDLWSGNLITDPKGNPTLIDPAVYYGWAETDLAMAELFGSYPDQFYKVYLDVNPLLPGYRERFPLYNLYHLLNHLNLFGRSYLSGVREVLRRFS